MSAHRAATTHTHYRRFDQTDRVLHGFLMFSFLGLAFTGLPLLFSHEEWAARLARFYGGFQAAGLIHRFCAILMIGLFVAPLLFGGSILGLALFREKPDVKERRVAIVDATGRTAAYLTEAAEEKNAREAFDQQTGRQVAPRYSFETVAPQGENPGGLRRG